MSQWPINFIFNEGGMGDFINYTPALLWLYHECPWVIGRIFAPRYLNDLMKLILKDCKGWSIFPSEEGHLHMELGTSYLGPSIYVNGVNTTKQMLTCIGAHPIDVGFAYYAGTTPPPPGTMLPCVDFSADTLPEQVKPIQKKYVVIPTGANGESRRATGKHINPLIDYIVEIGMTPVFLGKTDLLMDGKQTTAFPDDIHYHKGIDLRDKTSVIEAATIMQHAFCTAGLDCGLLHLACITKDSNVVFGYNITTIADREPRRNWGRTINVSVDKSELQCISCQSNLKLFPKHLFINCIYGDTKCIDLLFGNECERFKKAIEELRK